MARIIYLFREQFKLTKKEISAVVEIMKFSIKLYVRAWCECPSAIMAPFNDLNLLQIFDQYANKKIANTAYKAFAGHQWYLFGPLVGLALFDHRVSIEEKQLMQEAMLK